MEEEWKYRQNRGEKSKKNKKKSRRICCGGCVDRGIAVSTDLEH